MRWHSEHGMGRMWAPKDSPATGATRYGHGLTRRRTRENEKAFSASRALAARVRYPCLRVELRGPTAKLSWVIFCSGRLLGCLEMQYGHKRLGIERTATSSLVPFQPFQPGRNKTRPDDICLSPFAEPGTG